MESLIVENVRCFRKRQEVPLAPLTILVGENSTGKSTFLALVRLALELVAGRLPLKFNEEPFLLGAFDQIATAKRGRSGQAKSFLVGGSIELTAPRQAPSSRVHLWGELVSLDGQPSLSKVSCHLGERDIEVNLDASEFISSLSLPPSTRGGPRVLRAWDPPDSSLDLRPSLENLLRFLLAASGNGGRLHPRVAFLPVSMVPERYEIQPFAFAPIRSRPLRTYDPIRDTPGPEGAHVPMVLAQIFKGSSASARRLRESVENFGRASGLLGSVDVRRLGKGSGDPFQLQITIDGLPVNILDVGYGVSQALPILVDCLRGPDGGTFLLQQPEVHLHPRAQAELGSLFGALTQSKKQRFVIETHSDHLVDRVRMDIRDGKTGIRPEDVSLLYFERKNGEVEIAHLELDAQGNIIDPPPGYRRFFLDEERRFLGGW